MALIDRLRRRGEDVELIDAKAVNLPMLDRMYKEYPKCQAPEALEQLARKIRDEPESAVPQVVAIMPAS